MEKKGVNNMKIGGHPASEVIAAVFIILWAVIRFIAIGALVVGGIWLAFQSLIILFFFLVCACFASFKTKW